MIGSAPPSQAESPLAAATDYLYQLPRGSKGAGLARAAEFFDRLGAPQNAVRTAHVAGTAGKGSVSTFLASILTAHGWQVGAHLSPHVYSIRERFQVSGAPITEGTFVELVDRIAPVVDAMMDSDLGAPTFFEVANAIAFTHFAGSSVDYSVIETGIGGLLDATNTIGRPDKFAVITRIGLDHTDMLGETESAIARHKAGILPQGGQGIALRHPSREVRRTLAGAAQQRRCQLDQLDERLVSCDVSTFGTYLRIGDGKPMRLGLEGRHQGVNAALALRAAEHLSIRDGWSLDHGAARDGLATAKLPGRFEQRITVGGQHVVLDGAHNAVKLAALVSTLQDLYPAQRFAWVLALKDDKDLDAALTAVAPSAAGIVATEFHSGSDGMASGAVRSMPAGKVAERARAAGLRAIEVGCPLEAVTIASQVAGTAPVVISGSFLLLDAISSALTPETYTP
ncbi:bifunctional folylpolyglutamate synthase/dihydrofolate synthase [Rhodococcus sp. NPDC056960]|uniref:bifunctional folylpolyglutamate synthase/dihydrofolate synthase n=1 Tax=Rhodococcus sp. NPDC056960 TaxID=3345982 RepID=UPI003638D9B6